MTTLTIERVSDQIREWQSPDGKLDLRYITVFFEGGMKGSVSTKPDSVEKRLSQLKALIGKPGEFVLEGEKIRDFPGKSPAGGFGGGGGKGWQPKSVEERAEILAMNGLNAVVTLAAAQMAAGGAEAFPDAARKKSLDFVKAAMRELVGTATGLLKASGTEGASVSGKGATASSVPDDNVEAGGGPLSEMRGSQGTTPQPGTQTSASTTTSGASDPLDATPDRDGDGITKPQKPPSADQPEQGGAVSSRHVHEWKDAPREGWVSCGVCGIARKREDVEVSA